METVLEKSIGALTTALMAIAGVCITLMMVHVSLDVLMKYIFNLPIQGTLEIVSYYYMVAAVFLPLGAVERNHGQIFVEVFTQHLAPRRIAAIDGFAKLLGLCYVGVLTWMTGVESIRQTRDLEAWDAVFFDIPVWPTRWFLTLGCGAMLLYMALHAYRDLHAAFTGRGLSEAVKPAPIVME
ncbi:MAG: TRAP transporter small permease subunit [Alphaproteobacteria bacterium]|nr:TRAP transporter small permease subunit [Alphaproteobacteria bacterium]